jgi:dolichol-phosphate mannosyltransferase
MGDIYKKAADRGDVCITVVLPTLNEAEALPKVVEELRAAGYDKILVVDGGSTDGTLEKAKELGVAAVMQIGKGKGMALRTALMYVDTPYVAVIDADYSYPPAELSKLLPHLRHYDLVLGARQGPMPFIYKLGNKALAWLFRLLFGTDITDPLTGMYAARTDVLREAALEARHFDIEVDILAKAVANGARVAEVPIQYRQRIGKKKLKPWHGASIASKMISLAYRLNPTLPLTLAGALLTAPAPPWRDRLPTAFPLIGVIRSGVSIVGCLHLISGVFRSQIPKQDRHGHSCLSPCRKRHIKRGNNIGSEPPDESPHQASPYASPQ